LAVSPRRSRLHHRRIDDLTAHGEDARIAQNGVKPGKELLNGSCPSELLSSRRRRNAKQPDRLGIRRRIMQRQPDEAQEREPIPQLILSLVVRQRVQGLQHQNPEHQHRVVGRPPALAAIGALQGRLELGPEQLKVDDLRQPLQRVTGSRKRPVPLVQVEETRLSRHSHPRHCRDGRESRQPQLRHGFSSSPQAPGPEAGSWV
jgi:hypothetical protein